MAVADLFRCAAKGIFLVTGGAHSIINLGLMALRPSADLHRVAVRFAQIANFNYTGWDSSGHAPVKAPFTGEECGQGFLYALLFKKPRTVLCILQQMGGALPEARMIDICIWNHCGDFG